ncbi:MAG TPA: hypothetical protein VF217_07395 [Rhodanobacteraceae bacterium]
MLKLFLAALSWAFLSGGFFAVPNWLAAPGATGEAPRPADAYCSRGDWPDRARACQASGRPSLVTIKPKPAETAADLDRQGAQAAGPLAFNGGIRFYDASGIAETPVTAEAPAPGSTVVQPHPVRRPVRVIESTDSSGPSDTVGTRSEASAPPAHRPARAVPHRPAAAHRAVAPRRLAANAPARPHGLLRVYGVAF